MRRIVVAMTGSESERRRMPGGDLRLRSIDALEEKLQRKLNQPRTIQLVTRNSKSPIVRFTASSIRRGKLDAIKRIEELRPELQTEPFARTEARRLKYRKVPVIDPVAAKRRVYTRLISETKVAGSGEARRVEPGKARAL